MQLLRDYLFLIPIVVMVLSELAKAVVTYLRTGKLFEGFFRPGGFPSSHSALVTSLLIVVERKLGSLSTEFAIAFVFACIVWYDAMSLRRTVGMQSEMLNKLQQFKHFSERVGHSFIEVVGGIVFGAVVTSIGVWLSYRI